MDKGQGGPPSKRRRISRIRKPSRRAVEGAQNTNDPDIVTDNNEESNSPETADSAAPTNKDTPHTINIGSTINNTDLISMLNVAVPIITQTVVAVLKQSGVIPSSNGQNNPAIQSEVTNFLEEWVRG